MKNNQQDFTTPLRSDYIAREKPEYDYFRRPYNRNNPNELEFKPIHTGRLSTDENAVAANTDDNGAAFNVVDNTAGKGVAIPLPNTNIF